MALKVYENVGDPLPYSCDGLFTNPIIFSFDGRLGGAIEKKLYLRNDSSVYDYSGIQVTVNQSGGDVDYVGDSVGFAVKVAVGDSRPTDAEWATIVAANTISFADISGTATYLPFWVRVEVPYRIPVQHITSVRFLVTATEELAAP